MKKNIERVFKNLLLISILLTLILAITATVSYNEESNYDMIQSIQKQRVLIDEINELNIEDNQLNSIITREKIINIQIEISKLSKFMNSALYMLYMIDENYTLNSMKELQLLVENYSATSRNYYIETTSNNKIAMNIAKKTLIEHLDSILNKTITCSIEKYVLLKRLILISFTYSAFMMLWYRRKLKVVLDEIATLPVSSTSSQKSVHVDVNVQNTQTNSSQNTQNNDDEYSHINSKYSNLKPSDKNKIIALLLFEIDNFSENVENLEDNEVNKIVKKILSIFSIHEKGSDTFSYLENGKFFYLSLKDEKESTKKHAQSLYESINETEFQIGNEKKHLKIDASLIIKKREETLIKTMKSAEIELDKAKVSEDNKIKSPHIRF